MFGPPSTPTASDEAVLAEGRAGLYAFLANAWRHPEEVLLDALLGRARAGLVSAPNERFAESVNRSIHDLLEACDRLGGRPATDVATTLSAEHARLFGHAVRGTCPPYELEYGRSEIIQQTAELADLSGFYNAFGLGLRDSAFERGDHVSVECEFLSVLCAKQAWGLREGRGEMAETCWDAQRLFLRDHLARWSPAFAHRVVMADPRGFYGRVASLTSTLMEWECHRFGIQPGPQWLELRPADVERDAAIDCETGSCGPEATERLVQIGVENLSAGGHLK
jgi:TorA maturation chaperone TorD